MEKCNEIGFAVLLKNLDSAECVKAAFDGTKHLKADKTGFTLALWFCVKTLPEKGKEAVLVSGGGLSILLSGEELKLKFQEKQYSLLENVSVSPLLWHNIAVSFSNGTFVGFYDGITVYSGEAEFSNMDIQAERWELGKNFCGFLKDFRVFSQALSRDELCSVLYAEPESTEKISPSAWYVFTKNPPVEKMQKYAIVLCQASFTDVSSQIRFGGDTVFKYSDPATRGSDSYTLLLHIYPDTPKTKRQGIFSRTLSREEEKAALYLSSEGDQFYFEAQIGKEDGISFTLKSDKIEIGDLCRWYTIALVLGKNICSLWVDGAKKEEKRDFGGIESFCHMVYLGADGSGKEKGFTGYISYAAEFAACLSAEKIAAYAKTPPFLFDASIHSLFHPVQNLATGEQLREEITGNSLECAGVSFRLANRTTNYYATEALSYYTEGEAYSAKEYEAWRTEFFCGLCRLFFKHMYGMSPVSGYNEENKLLAEVGQRIAKDYALLAEFDSVLLQAGFDATEALKNLFGRLAESDFLHLYTRMFFMKNYVTENSLYTMSLEFLRNIFVLNQIDENYQNAFYLFVKNAGTYAKEMLESKRSYQDDTLAVSVSSVNLKKDGTKAILEAVLSYTLTGEKRTGKVKGWGEPVCFGESTEEGEVIFSPDKTEQTVSLEINRPRKLEWGKNFSFSIQFGEGKQSFLDYYTQ